MFHLDATFMVDWLFQYAVTNFARLAYDVEFAERAGPVVDKPGIHTFCVILVLAWKNAKFLKSHHQC